MSWVWVGYGRGEEGEICPLMCISRVFSDISTPLFGSINLLRKSEFEKDDVFNKRLSFVVLITDGAVQNEKYVWKSFLFPGFSISFALQVLVVNTEIGTFLDSV